jgi:hypothetical protein
VTSNSEEPKITNTSEDIKSSVLQHSSHRNGEGGVMKFRKKPVVIEAFRMTREVRESNTDWPEWAHVAWNAPRNSVGATDG